MRPAIRFLLPLLPVLAVLAWTAAAIVDRTGRAWFERDVELRAELALSGTHDGLVRHWRRGEWGEVRRVLEAITRDERILGAIACDRVLGSVARTSEAPAVFGCDMANLADATV